MAEQFDPNTILNNILTQTKNLAGLADLSIDKQDKIGEEQKKLEEAKAAQVPQLLEDKKNQFDALKILAQATGIDIADPKSMQLALANKASEAASQAMILGDKLQAMQDVDFLDNPIEYALNTMLIPGVADEYNLAKDRAGAAIVAAQGLNQIFDNTAQNFNKIAKTVNDKTIVNEKKQMLAEISIESLKIQDEAISKASAAIKAQMDGDTHLLNAYSGVVNAGVQQAELPIRMQELALRGEQFKAAQAEIPLDRRIKEAQARSSEVKAKMDELLLSSAPTDKALEDEIKQLQKQQADINVKLSQGRLDNAGLEKAQMELNVNSEALNVKLKELEVAKLTDPAAKLKAQAELRSAQIQAGIAAQQFESNEQQLQQNINVQMQQKDVYSKITGASSRLGSPVVIRNKDDMDRFYRVDKQKAEFLRGIADHRQMQEIDGVKEVDRYDKYGDNTYEAVSGLTRYFGGYKGDTPSEAHLLTSLRTTIDGLFTQTRINPETKQIEQLIDSKTKPEEVAAIVANKVNLMAAENMANVEGDKLGYYKPIPLKEMGAYPEVANSQLYNRILLPHLEQGLMKDEAEDIVRTALIAANQSQMSRAAVIKDLGTLFRNRVIAKNAQSNFRGYHVPMQQGYKIRYNSEVNDKRTGTYDLNDPVYLQRFVNVIEADTREKSDGWRGTLKQLMGSFDNTGDSNEPRR